MLEKMKLRARVTRKELGKLCKFASDDVQAGVYSHNGRLWLWSCDLGPMAMVDIGEGANGIDATFPPSLLTAAYKMTTGARASSRLEIVTDDSAIAIKPQRCIAAPIAELRPRERYEQVSSFLADRAEVDLVCRSWRLMLSAVKAFDHDGKGCSLTMKDDAISISEWGDPGHCSMIIQLKTGSRNARMRIRADALRLADGFLPTERDCVFKLSFGRDGEVTYVRLRSDKLIFLVAGCRET